MKNYILLIFSETPIQHFTDDDWKVLKEIVGNLHKYKILDMRTGAMISQSDNFN